MCVVACRYLISESDQKHVLIGGGVSYHAETIHRGAA